MCDTDAAMAGDGSTVDPRMMKVNPRIRYNTIGGVNGPLVILENVRELPSKTECLPIVLT